MGEKRQAFPIETFRIIYVDYPLQEGELNCPDVPESGLDLVTHFQRKQEGKGKTVQKHGKHNIN